MDAPTLTWLHRNILPLHVTGKSVLEVGSMDVNGSVRGHVASLEPADYLGVDIAAGPGVDRVANVHELAGTVGQDAYPLVISTEMLEHVEDWRSALHQLKTVTKPGGTLVLTTRRPGFPRHCYPHDHWRFTPTLLWEAFRDFEAVTCTSLLGRGVAVRARKPMGWAPVDLSGLHARPAPSYDLPWTLFQAWVKVAYLGTNPDARRLLA